MSGAREGDAALDSKVLPMIVAQSFRTMPQMRASIPRPTHRGGKESGEGRTHCQTSDSPSSISCVDGHSHFQETKRTQGLKGVHWEGNMSCYRSQLEKDVQMLEKQLQEEIDLHVALTQAVGNNFSPLPISRLKLPVKAQQLLDSIVVIEKIVANLEEEICTLHFCLQHEREHHDTECHLKHLPISSLKPSSSTSGYLEQEQVSSLRVSMPGRQLPLSLHLDVLRGCENSKPLTGTAENRPSNEVLISSSGGEEKKLNSSLQLYLSEFEGSKMNLWQHPNELSEEMVLCMRTIFLCLSGSSTITSKASLLEGVYSPTSSVGRLSLSSLLSSDSFRFPSSIKSSPDEFNRNCEVMGQKFNDPYGVNDWLKWTDIGKYSLASEVSWLSVGKVQLEYSAEILKKFRFLVDQLAEVNPSKMSSDEKLAFWINLYNALIMHAYLAYGTPRSEFKLFSLMKKASYTVGGQSFSAADIEFILLKMKPPAHRPQIALVLTLHKFKMSKEHKKYSIDCSEPLALFALSCGMYSCPAVRIFTAKTVQDELQKSMKDYIQASVGINHKGKLLVPKLLYCFAKGVVEDSFLVDWICRHLTTEQAAIVRGSARLKKKRLVGSRSFSIIPFNSRFRYLFLPCNKSF